MAAQGGYVECMEVLLRNGTEIEAKNTYGATALLLAARHGHRDAVEYLLDKGANGTCAGDDGYTPLHWASEQGHSDVVELLVNRCSTTINAPTPYVDGLQTPLHLAAEKDRVECIEVLVQGNADLEAKAKYHCTPLHTAARKAHVRAVECLLRHGADVTAKDADGERPLQMTWRNRQKAGDSDRDKYDDVIEVLFIAGTTLNASEQLPIDPEQSESIDRDQVSPFKEPLSVGARSTVYRGLWLISPSASCR